MARPRKSKGSLKVQRGNTRPASSGAVPDVYREMLRDAVSSSPPPSSVERPLKRRRVGGATIPQKEPESLSELSDRVSTTGHITDGAASEDQHRSTRDQIAYQDSGDSAESDVNWEEVDLKEDLIAETNDSAGAQDLNLVLDDTGASKENAPQQPKRRLATPAERRLKLDIHKLHVLCLLAHVHLRNHWCNDEKVHELLRSILSKKTVSYLNPNEDLSQFQRTRSLTDGLSQAVDAFKLSFIVSARGMYRSHWAEDVEKIANIEIPRDLDLPMQKADFRDAAAKREGSRDVGAQLFCAMLRSAGVDARLACSLQALPFRAYTKTKPMQSKDSMAIEKYYNERGQHREQSVMKLSDAHYDGLNGATEAIGSVGGRSRFTSNLSIDIAQGSGSTNHRVTKSQGAASINRRKRIAESPYPIYWIEAFDEAAQRWIPVDPLVTKTVGKPRKFEPPTSDRENNMSYVVSFEDDGSARDVTKRYAKAYNAKTRKTRVEATSNGERWLRSVLRMYKGSHRSNRDQVEDTELANKEAQEGLPQNIQDFKDHPYYALERHLRRNEVIHPKREVGKVSAGRAGSAKGVEPIYRRHDLHIVKSANSWYRIGREIRAGEQPLKRAVPRRAQASLKEGSLDAQLDEEEEEDDDDDDDDAAGTSLYAAHQTVEYKSPPVVNGKIPKNVYGNLDLYVPSMIPAGAVHLHNPETPRAAKLLGVDYADAVTGFKFKGRHGAAITNGTVVASVHAEAVQEVLNAFQDERAKEEAARRSLEALRMWKKLLAGLRIRERIEGYEVEGERDANMERATSQDDAALDSQGGGFFLDPLGEPVAEPTAGRISYSHDSDVERKHRNDISAHDGTRRRMIEKEQPYQNDSLECSEELDGGGFLINEDDEDAAEALNPIRNSGPEYQMSNPFTYNKRKSVIAGDVVEDLETGQATERITVKSSESASISRFPNQAREQRVGHTSISSQGEFQEESPREARTEFPERHSERYMAAPELELADDELAEATLLQQSYETSTLMTQPIATEFEAMLSVAGSSSTPETRGSPHQRMQEEAATPELLMRGSDIQNSPLSIASASRISEDETGSLLAEDPSDEDADPEWLV